LATSQDKIAILIISIIYFCLDNSRINNSYVVINMGDSRQLTCNSVAQTTWKYNNSEILPSNVETKKNELYIYNAHLDNVGMYECSGYNEQNELFLAEYSVIVRGWF